MKIYTRTGDRGETGLGDGRRVPKDSPRVATYGEVDELNSLIGVCLTTLTEPDLVALLGTIQDQLFTLQADLALPLNAKRPGKRITSEQVAGLEQAIDRYDAELEPLRSFILPGGSQAGALLHYARTVARRAERAVVHLQGVDPVNPQALIYLNRLSDLLFVLARWQNQRDGRPETPPTYA
ncbi:MAG: cob(I)yrinic acid a,c-diamide adenosyltransferase [Deltaproteobacteria bacterium]|nr:cob(I)yrinic acid a,c-diamide adenosyltransferase [Deltaproteobacteria bacterium]